MAGAISGWATHDPEGDWPLVSEHVAAQFDSYRRHMVEGTNQPIPRPVDPDALRSRSSSKGVLDRIIYGTPEEFAEQVASITQGAPVETVFLWASIAGMGEEMVVRNVKTICTDLASLLDDFDPMRTVK